MAGRRPKPTALKKAEGNPGGRKLNENEVESEPLSEDSPPPEHMSEQAKLAWCSIVENYAHTNVIQKTDELALEQLCETYADVRTLQEEIAITGMNIFSTNRSGVQNIKRNPAVGTLAAARKDLRMWLVEFGLTPSARAKLHSENNNNNGEDDPFGDFLNS